MKEMCHQEIVLGLMGDGRTGLTRFDWLDGKCCLFAACSADLDYHVPVWAGWREKAKGAARQPPAQEDVRSTRAIRTPQAGTCFSCDTLRSRTRGFVTSPSGPVRPPARLRRPVLVIRPLAVKSLRREGVGTSQERPCPWKRTGMPMSARCCERTVVSMRLSRCALKR